MWELCMGIRGINLCRACVVMKLGRYYTFNVRREAGSIHRVFKHLNTASSDLKYLVWPDRSAALSDWAA